MTRTQIRQAVLTPTTLIPIGVAVSVGLAAIWSTFTFANERAVTLQRVTNNTEAIKANTERISNLEERWRKIDQALYRLELHAGTLPSDSVAGGK